MENYYRDRMRQCAEQDGVRAGSVAAGSVGRPARSAGSAASTAQTGLNNKSCITVNGRRDVISEQLDNKCGLCRNQALYLL